MFINLIYNEASQRYEASYPSTGSAIVFGTSLGSASFATGLFGDGTSGAPSIAFTAEPTLGLRRISAALLGLEGSLQASVNIIVSAAGTLQFSGRTALNAPGVGITGLNNIGFTSGVWLKTDATPAYASGFGTTPVVTTGSTPLAGSINVGTGGVATTGAITWGGTAFPSTPFIAVTCSAGAVPTVAVATTTGVTFTTSVAWPASTIVNWIAISARA